VRRQTQRQVTQSLDDLAISSDHDEEDGGQSFPVSKGSYQPSIFNIDGFEAEPEEGTRGVKRQAADMDNTSS
jgi:hypothetical protein